MLLDYLLYDNRTLGTTSRDWGLKVWTGALAQDGGTRRLFVEHCRRAFDARLGTPRDFGAALGGFPIQGRGYLLCVTLEIEDWAGRATCGFVGIHCPDPSTLRALLETFNPLQTARGVYDGETPPARLEARGTALLDPDSLRDVETIRTNFRNAIPARFVRSESPRRAVATLRTALDEGERPPSILGIATWQSRKVFASAIEQIIFFQHLPENLVIEPTTHTQRADAPSSRRNPPDRGPRAAYSSGDGWYVWIELSIVCILVALYGAAWLYFQTPSAIPSFGSTATTVPPRLARPETRGGSRTLEPPSEAELLLDRIDPLVHEALELDPESLRVSRIYETLVNVEVRSEYQGQRAELRRLLDRGLPEFRSALIDVNLAFYFSAEKKEELSAAERARGVLRNLKTLAPPAEGCRSVRRNFRSLMARQGEEVAIWCRLVEAFAEEKQRAESRSP